MIYVFRSKASESARELAEAMNLNCRKITDLRTAHYGNGVRAGDVVIAWGEAVPPINGVKVLNGAPLTNKMTDAEKLKAAGVATVEVSRQRPPITTVNDHYEFRETNGRMNRDEVRALANRLQAFLATPVPQPSVWLPRRFNHVGGNDLLNAPAQPDFWSKKEDITEEYRLHVFKGKSIRAGVKQPRAGATAHPWVRSYNGGWSITYNDFHSKKSQRELAAKAVEALGLDFGAVDLAKTREGKLVVLEVNRGPGLEGGTTLSYAKAIEDWVREG